MRSRRAIAWAVAGVVCCAVIGVVAAVRRASPSATVADDIVTGRVKRGDLEMKVHATAELRAVHTTMLTAPTIGGGALQITHLLHSGTVVKKGDLVMEFDPSEQHYKLEQNRSELLQAEQEIAKTQADAAVTAAEDKVAMLKARYDVRRAELEVQKNELVSTIDAKKNQLALEQAQRVLAELEQDVKSRKVSGQATIALAEEKRNKAKLAMDQAEQNIGKMRLTAPMDGLVALEKNGDAAGGFFFDGMSLPEYREGDQVEPGRTVGQVIDPNEMELAAKVGEIERNNIKEGQPVDIQLDALPGSTLQGTVKTIGGNSTRMFWEDDTSTKFEVAIKLSTADPRLRPGLTAQIVIAASPHKDVLYVPHQAVFMKDSKRVIFVRAGNNFEPREVKIEAEDESRAAIEGVSAGTEVALIDPTAPRKAANSGAPAPGAGGGAP
jgi:HlyD family secretion protein